MRFQFHSDFFCCLSILHFFIGKLIVENDNLIIIAKQKTIRDNKFEKIIDERKGFQCFFENYYDEYRKKAIKQQKKS